MLEKSIEFEFKARIVQSGEINDHTRHLFIVFHGHGHLASYFLRKFEVLFGDDTVVMAPEGLSRYYLEGFTGKVGATWMTKEERLTDISNYLAYLNKMVDKLVLPHLHDHVKVTLLGFSQGAATVSRWAIQTSLGFHRLVLWAGIFPPDLDYPLAHQRLKDIQIINVIGKNDPYLNPQRQQEQKTATDNLGHNPEVLRFEGGHELNNELLLKIKAL